MPIEDILEIAKKVAEQADVYTVESEETPVGFETNRLKTLQTKQSLSIGVRLVKNGRIGVAAASGDFDPQALVGTALEVAQFGAEAKFELPGPLPYPKVEVYDPDVEQVTIDQMVHLGQSLIDEVRVHNPDVICEVGVSKYVGTVHLLNTSGCDVSYRKSIFSLNLEGQLIRGTDMLFVGDGDSSCHPLMEAKRVVAETLRQLEVAKEIAQVTSGKLPVIFTPHGVRSALVGPLATAFNGKVVLQGASPLGHRLGEQVFDPRLNVWDDATLDFRPASALVDDEGIPTRRTSLVDGGRATSFLYDLQTAGLAGKQSTGNGSRSPGSLPTPSLHAVVIGSGDVSFEEMVTDVKEGLVVEHLMGAGQGNVLGGDFGGNVLLGYKIEKGHIVGRVKDTMVAGNVYEALKEINALGNQPRWVGGSLYTPAILCQNLSVSSKAG